MSRATPGEHACGADSQIAPAPEHDPEGGEMVEETGDRGPGGPGDGGEGAGNAAPARQDPRLTAGQIQQLLMIGLIGVTLTVFVVAELSSGPHGGRSSRAAGGVTYFEVTSRSHVTGPFAASSLPPVGGDHAAIWQNCGFYDEVIPTETAIHSLEHGAVWVVYRKGLAPGELDALRRLSAAGTKVLVSAWEGDLPAPLVASAWASQRALTTASDPALEDFVRRFSSSPRSPEHDGACTAGQG